VIGGDAINPSAKIGVSGELLQFLITTQKSFLHNFLRVLAIAHHSVRKLVDTAAVPLNEDTVSVAITGEGAFDGLRVAD
jgi:hypothetical protein